MNKEVIHLAAEISMFVQELTKTDGGTLDDQFDFEDDFNFEDAWDFSYAEALFDWLTHGKNPKSFYSTDHPLVLQYKEQLSNEFGLEIVDPIEAERRDKLRNTNTFIVDGFGTGHKVTTEEALMQRAKTVPWLQNKKLLN